MRLYAFLLVAGAALCARAASIPVAETEKKLISIIPDNFDKLPEILNTSSEQELINQANTIKDVDNKVRAKPEDIPVEVFVENAQLALLTDEELEEEINRSIPDLRNPGQPQRQEHETQNPEYYASEQQTVALFKQSINDAQNVLRQGFQGITDGIQNIIETNEPIQTLQQNIQSLRDSFTAQIIKVNGTIQSYLNTESASSNKPAVEQTKAGFHQIEQGLFKLRNDFNRGVSTLAGGVEVVAALKADSDTPNNNSSSISTPASPAPSPAPVSLLLQIVNSMQNRFQNTLNSLTEQYTTITQSLNPFNQVSSTTAAPIVTEQVQSDSQVTSAPSTSTNNFIQGLQNQFSNWSNTFQAQTPGQSGPLGIQGIFARPPVPIFSFGNGPVAQAVNGIINYFQNTNSGGQAPQGTQPAPSGQPAQTPSKPEEAVVKPSITPEAQADPAKPAAGAETPAQATAVTPAGPIRQILQNNPITQGIAGAVQRLQNINNPEKPRDEQTAEQVKKLDEDKADPESKKGGGPNTGDNNDSSDSRVGQPEEVKEEIEKLPEVQKVPEVQNVPEVQKTSEDEIKEHKTEEVVDKTE